MLRKLYFILALVIFQSLSIVAQDSLLVGKRYLEDQLYLGLTYNQLINKQDIVNQKGLSLGIQSGFIKDIPLNKTGTFAIGIGLGYDYSKIQSNIFPQDQEITLVNNYSKNKIETHAIALPVEFRYRTSSDKKFKFWRVYAGFKVAYSFHTRVIYDNYYTLTKDTNPKFINRWQAGPQLCLGYNTINIYAYWNAIPLFNDAPLMDTYDSNKLTYLKMGIQFYIF